MLCRANPSFPALTNGIDVPLSLLGKGLYPGIFILYPYNFLPMLEFIKLLQSLDATYIHLS
jgi:hypothetical protein